MDQRGRIPSVQAMRGLAALLVVVVHAMDLVVGRQAGIGTSYLSRLGHLENFGACGVDLFFVISGFVMALSVQRLAGPRDAGSFLALRWVRIVPPFLVACALLVVHGLARSLGLPDWRSFANAVLLVPVVDTSTYTPPPLDIGWTLSFEFTFYLAVAALVAARRSKHVDRLLVALVGTSLLGLVWQPGVFILHWVLNPIGLEFGLGVAAYLAYSSRWFERARKPMLAAGILGLAALVVELVVGYGRIDQAPRTIDGDLSFVRVLLWGLPMLGLFLAGLVMRRGPRLLAPTFLAVGDASYSIYLVHIIVMLVISRVLVRSPADIPGDVVLVMAVLLSVIAGMLYFRFVERPLTELLRLRVARLLGIDTHLRPARLRG